MGETDDLEWDDHKNAANIAKHGVPLTFAAVIMDGRPRLERLSQKGKDEARVEVMAEVAGRVLFCVYVWRGARRRIISVRRAHRSEQRAYEEATRRG